jgi:hypothetical protein
VEIFVPTMAVYWLLQFPGYYVRIDLAAEGVKGFMPMKVIRWLIAFPHFLKMLQ